MKNCTDNDIGRLLPFYETAALSQEDSALFEEHLFECEYCLHEFESSRGVSLLLRRHADSLRDKFQAEERGFEHELASLESTSGESDERSQQRTRARRLDSPFGSRRLWTVSAPAALFLTLMSFLSTSRDTVAPRTPGLTETRVPPDSSEVIPPRQEQTLQTGVAENSPTVQAYDSLPTQDSSVSQVGARLASDVEALLPRVPIPYLGLITRGKAESSQDANFARAMTAYSQGEYDTAIGLITTYLESHPNDAYAFMYLGSAYYMTREFQRSVGAFSQSERLSPGDTDPSVAFYKAVALLQLGRQKEALLLLEYLSSEPNNSIAQSSADILQAAKRSTADQLK